MARCNEHQPWLPPTCLKRFTSHSGAWKFDQNQEIASAFDPALRRCVLVHPDDLPDVPVEIVEAPAEHESAIDRRPSFDRARAQSRLHHLIDLGLALQG